MYNESLHVFPAVLSVSAAVILYLLDRYSKNNETKRNLAQILKIEAQSNLSRLVPIMESQTITYRWFRRNVYRGIVSSGNIQYFHNELQKNIHDLYFQIPQDDDTHITEIDYVSDIDNMIKMLDQMTADNPTAWKKYRVYFIPAASFVIILGNSLLWNYLI